MCYVTSDVRISMHFICIYETITCIQFPRFRISSNQNKIKEHNVL